MNDNESRKWLYNTLQSEGYNVGSNYEEFDSLMNNNEESRKWCFDRARELGYNVGKDYDEFNALVGPQNTLTTEQHRTESGANDSRGLSVSTFTPGFVGQENSGVRAPLANAEAYTPKPSTTVKKPEVKKPTEASDNGQALGPERFQKEMEMTQAVGSMKNDFSSRMDAMRKTSQPFGGKAIDALAPARRERVNEENQKEVDESLKVAMLPVTQSNAAVRQAWANASARTAQERKAGRFVGNEAARLKYHDIDRMSEEAWNSIDEQAKTSAIKRVSQVLRESYGMPYDEARSNAEKIVRSESDKMMYEEAVRSNAPKGFLDYLVRKINDNAFGSIMEGWARSKAGTVGDMLAEEEANEQYRKENWLGGIAGDVLGFAAAPEMWLGGGLAGGIVKGGVAAGGKIFGKAAMNKALESLIGKSITKGVSSGINLGTFNAIGEASSQYKHGGVMKEDGTIGDYSLGSIGQSAGKGTLAGLAIGPTGELIGNVGTTLARRTASTVGKAAIRGAQGLTSIAAEGTIFVAPEMLSGELTFDDWLSSVELMAAFKLQGAVAPRRVRQADGTYKTTSTANEVLQELAGKRGNSRQGFETRLRTMLDRDPSLALTKDEEDELERGGYGDLKALVKDYNKTSEEQRKAIETKQPVYLEPNAEGEIPYNRFIELVEDKNISEAARAKMYYYVTGHGLPQSTVMGSTFTEHKDAKGNVTGYEVQSIGLQNGVITSRTFKNRRDADLELERINRQAELNGVAMGEQAYDNNGDSQRMYDAYDIVGKRKGISAEVLRNKLQRKPEELNDLERQWDEEVREVYNALPREDYQTAENLRKDVGKEYNVDIDEVISKEPARRSETEKAALVDYMEKLYGVSGEKQPDFDVDNTNLLTKGQSETTNGDGQNVSGINEAYRRGYDADEQTRRDIAVEMADGNKDAQEAWDGVVQKINEEADYQVALLRDQYEQQKFQADGSLRPATLKDGKQVYLTTGKVVMTADGTNIDVDNSDKTVAVYDPAEGKAVMIGPNDIEALGEVTSAEDFESGLEQERQQYVQQQIDIAQNKVVVEPGQTFTLEDGSVATILASDGETITFQKADGTQANMPIAEVQRVADNLMMKDYEERHSNERQQASQTAMVSGAPDEYVKDMEITVKGENGEEKTVYVTGERAQFTAKGFQLSPDGKFVELYDPEANDGNGDMIYIREDDPENKIVGWKPEEQPAEESAEPTAEQVETPVETTEQVTEQPVENVQNPETYLPEDKVTQPYAVPDAMPMREETRSSGKNAVTETVPDWYAVTPERAHRYLYDELGFTPEVADATVKANMDEVAKAISAHTKAEPKPTANPLAYKAAHDAWQEQMDALQGQQRYWEGVQAVQQAAVKREKEFFGEIDAEIPEWLQNKVKEARGNRKTLLMQAVEEIGNDPEALAELENEEPMTLEEVAAWALVNGAKLMRSDEKLGASVIKGLASMTGYNSKELDKFIGMFAKRANGGVGVDEFGEIVARDASQFGITFDELDAMAGTNALLELFSQAQTKGDIIDYILKNRIESAKNIHDRTINLRNERFKEKNGVSIEEYIAEDVFWKEVAADLAAMTDEEYEYIKSSEYGDEGRTGSNIGAPEATEKRTGPEIGEPETAESGAVVDNGRSRMENGGDSESKEEGGQGNVRPQVSGDTHNAVGEGAGREGATESSATAESAAVEQPAAAKETREQRDKRLEEERRQRILDNGTLFDEPFGLVPVSVTMTAEDIENNVQRIVQGLKDNEGTGNLDGFYGFAYNGAYKKNAGHQVGQYLFSLADVIPQQTLAEWYDRHGLKTQDDLQAYGEKLYTETEKTAQPSAEEVAEEPVEAAEQKFINNRGEEFEWNEHGICLNPNKLEYKKGKNNYSIETAQTEKGWVGSCDAFTSKSGIASPVSNKYDEVFESEEACQAYQAMRALDFFNKEGVDDKALTKSLTEIIKADNSTDDLYQRHYDAAVKEIESILDGVERGEGVVVSPEMTDAIQKIADIGEEAERRLEDSTLPEDERVRLQAQYDATDKWLDENVRGEEYTAPARKEGEDMVDYAERVAKGLKAHDKLTKRKKSTNKKKSVSLQSENEPDLFSGIEEAAPSEAASAEQSEPVEDKTPKKVGNKIEDVGEKIGGARKDLAQQMSSKINLEADTFPKMFPKFDLKKMVEQGLDPKLASAVYFLRMTAQEEYKRKAKKNTKQSALGSAKFFAAYAKRFLENGDTNTDFTDNGWAFTEYGKKFIDCNLVLFDKVHDKLGDDIFDLDLSGYAIYPVERNSYSHYYRKNEQGETVEIHPSYNARAKFSTSSYYMEDELDKAVDELTDKIAESVSYKASHPYKLVHYYTPGQKDSSYVGVKLGGKIVALTDKMNSSELQKYLNEHEAELQEKARLLDEERKQGKKEGGDGKGRWKPELNLGGMRSRVGDDYRNGRDITADEFRDTFGFRGVEFGNYVNQTERQKFLNEAYDALLDMAKLLDVSPKALSLGGQLGFAIGARGGGKAAAHYEPELNVINLTKTQGAGSLAHEWWHSMDYYFNREGDRRKTPATANTRAEMFNPGQRREIEDAFVDLMDKINGGDYFKRSVALEGKLHPNTLKTGYYDNPTELGARAFQDYVRRRLTDRGQVNDFLSSFTSEDKWNGEPETYPYPTGDEANEIDEKFDDLFATIQEKTDEAGNVLLYHKADSNVQPLSEVQGALNEGLDEILGETIGSDYHTNLDEGQQKIMELGDNFHPQKVYHGSGADFERFDSSHMGEGEGAQAYGYGHYTTEVEGIGRTYAGQHDGYVNYDGRKLNYYDGIEISKAMDFAVKAMINARGDKAKAIDIINKNKASSLYPQFNKNLDEAAELINNGDVEYVETKSPTLYTVDIPDDNGSNYLKFDKPATDEQVERIKQALLANEKFQKDSRDEYDFTTSRLQDIQYIPPFEEWIENRASVIAMGAKERGERAYNEIAKLLDSEKAASDLLHSAGFTGIKYPAEFRSGGRSDGASNYVIFDENDLKITNKVKFFRTPDGTVYGFTVNGQIYIDPRIATPETRIHEYAHLWAQGLRRSNQDAWEQLKSEMAKQKDVMAKVKEMYPELIDKNNPDALTDDMMEEVFAHYSGRRGAERLEADMREEMRKADGFVEKAQVANVFHKIKELLNKFWNMARDLFAGKFKGIEKLSGEDFADMMLGDLLGGFDPRTTREEAIRSEEAEIERKAKADGTWMKAPNGKPSNLNKRQWVQVRTNAFKEWFGDWEKAAKQVKVADATDLHFVNNAEFKEYAKNNFQENGKWKSYVNKDTGNEIHLSSTGINKSISNNAVEKSKVSRSIHLRALGKLDEILENSILGETHADKNGQTNVPEIQRYYGAVVIDGNIYRVKTTVKRVVLNNKEASNRQYSFQVQEMELIEERPANQEIGDAQSVSNPTNSINSISGAKLLKNVESDAKIGKKLLDFSQVVDNNGEPLVVYHGAYDGGFTIFDKKMRGTATNAKSAKRGFFFTDDRGKGEEFARRSASGQLYETYLDLKNPIIVDFKGESVNADEELTNLINKAKREGKDGVIALNLKDGFEVFNQYVAFEPNQIKSATSNVGTFDSGNADIRYQKAGGNGGEYKTPKRENGEDLIDYAKRVADDHSAYESISKASDAASEGESEKAFDYRNMGTQERLTAMAANLAARNAADSEAKNRAYRTIGNNLADLRKAMSLQKEFDKNTVKRVADLARTLLRFGYLNDINRGEIGRLLSAVKNSTGKADISGEIRKVMDIMVDSQLRAAEESLKSMEKVKASKVDAKGVEVQGVLDVAGQKALKTFKETRGWSEDELTEAMAIAQDKFSSNNDSVVEDAVNEYIGLQAALWYVQNIKASIKEERDLRQELADARSAVDRSMEYENTLLEAIQQNKIERTQAYNELSIRLGNFFRKSIGSAKAFKDAEVARVREIQHNANSDMEGRPAKEHYEPKWRDKFVNNSFVQFAFSPLATFDQMLRLFGSKSANGEGYLYNRFMRGWVDSRQKEIRGVRSKYAILDEKVHDIFGKEAKDMADLIRMTGNMPKAVVLFRDGGELKEHTLTQGNLLYIYMVNKMRDGRMKLRNMGIDEKKVAEIMSILDPRLVELADWIQDEFLVESRNEYNETHKRVFGASMAAIENYFPLKILSNARVDKTEDLDNPNINEGISTKTGSIIKRRMNTLALDITGADALSVILDHVAQMEHWNAFAEYNRDLNTLRTYKHFRNQVKNMRTIYGSGDKLWKKFNDVCQMATGSYRPQRADLDVAAVNFAKGVTAAKVSFRIFTALKQFLSMPAYIPDARPDLWAKNLATPWKSWSWAMENLPVFEERWKSRIAGDPRLMKSELDWKGWRNNIVQIASRIGMSPNAFVDALTVSIGAKTIYETRKARYLKEGYGKEQSERRAIQDAEIAYNQTQQSSEGAFLSSMQVDRSWLSVVFSVFRNSSMAYQRQLHDALRNLKRDMKKGNKAKSVEHIAKQMEREGVDADKTQESAEKRYNRQIGKDILRVATFGYIMQFCWNLGAYLPYLLFGDDDDKKKNMWDDVFAKSFFGWAEGLTGGDVISEAGKMIVQGEGNPEYLKKEMPITSDAYKVLQEIGNGKYGEVINDMVNLVVQAGIGVNPQSITDAVLAVMDACGDDPALAHEAMIAVMRILQVPQSQIKEIYFDEVGLSGDEISEYTPQQLAERYARYQVKRGRLLAPWTWDDKTLLGKEEKKANTTIKERMKRFGSDEVNEAYAKYEDIYKEVAEQVKEANRAKKIDYVEYARQMAELQNDQKKYNTYLVFKNMDKHLDELVKGYLNSTRAAEADVWMKEISQYKAEMVKALDDENNK